MASAGEGTRPFADFIVRILGKTDDAAGEQDAQCSLDASVDTLRRFANRAMPNLLSCNTLLTLENLFEFIASFASENERPTSVAIAYAGDFATSKSVAKAVLQNGDKCNFLQLLGVATAKFPSAAGRVQVIVLIDSACPQLVGTSSKSRNIRPEAVMQAIAEANGKIDVIVAWPIPTLAQTVSMRPTAHSESDESDSDSGAESKPAGSSPTQATTVLSAGIAEAVLTMAESGAGNSDFDVAFARAGTDALKKMAIPAELGVVSSSAWYPAWLSGGAPSPPAPASAAPPPPPAAPRPQPPATVGPAPPAGAAQIPPAPEARATEADSRPSLNAHAREFAPPPVPSSAASTATYASVPSMGYPSTAAHPVSMRPGMPAMGHTPYTEHQSDPRWAAAQPEAQWQPQSSGGGGGTGDRRGIFYCDVCQCDVFGEHNWALHLASDKHKRRSILTNPEMAGRLDATQTAMLVNPKNFFKCDVCNVVISGQANILQHVTGSQHKKNAARKGIVLPPDPTDGSSPQPPQYPADSETPTYEEYKPTKPAHADPSRQEVAECRTCGQTFANDEDLFAHARNTHSSGPSRFDPIVKTPTASDEATRFASGNAFDIGGPVPAY